MLMRTNMTKSWKTTTFLNYAFLSAVLILNVNCSSLGKMIKKKSAPQATETQKQSEEQPKAFGSVDSSPQKNLEKEVQVTALMSKMSETSEPAKVSATAPQSSSNWSYAGKTGPANWGDINPAWSKCKTGTQQSPINLKWRKPVKEQPITFNYSASLWSLIDDGSTLRVNFSKNNKFVINGSEYELSHIQFKSPSEHKLSKRGFPLEMQMVHRTSQGEVAIVSVFFKDGSPYSPASELFKRWPQQVGIQTPVPDSLLNPADFLPQRLSYYEYMGSLTTPPCSENVRWVILNTPLEMSMDQLTNYRKRYSNTNRPIQPTAGRRVINYP